MSEPVSAASDRDKRLKRIKYQSWHRGCKETDSVLGRFVDEYLHRLSDDEIELLDRFLLEDDADIWKWVTGREEPPSHTGYSYLIGLIKGQAK